MKRGTNNLEVKKLNRNRVFRYVNCKQQTSMPEISAALNISTPTVLAIVNELQQKQVIKENGEFESTGGRKAKVIAVVREAGYAIGLDITRNHVGLVCTDLTEKALNHKRIRKTFRYSTEYLKEVSKLVVQFVQECRIPEERIVGMGMSLPGIIDCDRKIITNSQVLGVYNVMCEDWTSYMPYPCEILNDASAAAITELAGREEWGNLVYLSLSNTVGGAAAFKNEIGEDAEIYNGNNWRSCEFGHMVIHPEGEICYCGKRGCLDAYCSALKLADRCQGNLEDFFREMEAGNQTLRAVWEEYMKDLLLAVDNLRMCFDCKVILGGYVGEYIRPYLQEIRKMAAERNIFEKDGLYIEACRYQKEASALGAAIYQIEKFIDTI